VKFSYGKGFPCGAAWMALLLSFPSSAQIQARFRVVEYRNTGAGQVRIGGPPVHSRYAPPPQYTEEARKAGIAGTVVLEATLGKDGCLRDVRPIRTLGYGLDESAIEAVRRWKFEPFLKNGVTAETRVAGELTFNPAWSPSRSPSRQRTCDGK
jgi:TonB family protein